MFEINAKLNFDPSIVTKKHKAHSSWKHVAIAKLDGDMHLYYAWLLERRFGLELVRPLRGAHVTIISDIVDNDIYKEAREFFHGKEIKLYYEPSEIRTNGDHWWIKIYSKDAENIRSAMGLTPTPYFNFHLTLGKANKTGLPNDENLKHSKYILDCIKFYGL